MPKAAADEIRIFRSTRHPGDRPVQWVYAQEFITPLAACCLPVMIATVIAALRMTPLWPFMLIGFPGALIAAALWTRFKLGLLHAEIFVHNGMMAIRSIQECLAGRFDVPWYPVLEVRIGKEALSITTSDATHILKRAHWPQHEDLQQTLIEARHLSQRTSYPGS